jgi:TolB-like protein/DNA-binding winged helix-turn-helix (wHTH) protein
MDRSAITQFDGWTLLRLSGELLREGRRVRLQDQPLQILEELLARPGELVTREQLICKLWPKQVVDYDTALNAAVRRLRSVLGDEAEMPRYIETIPRRGYRFIGTLAAEATADADHPPLPQHLPRRMAIIALLAAFAAGLIWLALPHDPAAPAGEAARPAGSAVPSIVVLPFVDLVAEPDSRYFADGLTEELINRLARNEQLRVIARTSSFALQGKNADIATVARQLNVSHVLEGSVRRSGDRLRVTAQLIDATTSSHLWSQNYDRRVGDVFEIQDDIAASVADALAIRLGGARSSEPSVDPRAYDKALLGRFLLNRRAPADTARAREHYEQAIAIDPEFAQGWAGLASVLWIQITDGSLERATGLEKMREAANRALALDPRLAEPHARLALYAWVAGNENEKRKQVQIARELEPNNPLVMGWAVGQAAAAGRHDEAVELQTEVARLDPLSGINRYNLAYHLYAAGQYEDAIAEMRRTLELNPAESVGLQCFSLVLLRRFDEAARLARGGATGADHLECEALLRHALGQRAESNAALAELTEEFGRTEPFRIAEVHAYRGEADAAFRWLQKTSEICRDQSRFPVGCALRVTRHSPLLASLRSDSRWAEWSGQQEY